MRIVTLLAVRVQVNVLMEAARKDSAIGSSLEAGVTLRLPVGHPALHYLRQLADAGDLVDVLSCSSVAVVECSTIDTADKRELNRDTKGFTYASAVAVKGADSLIK